MEGEVTRILIVEDSAEDAELAQRALLKFIPVCDFQRVDTREDYLAALESYQPHLIISDYSMPSFDGMTAIKLAKEHAPFTPVIVWTGTINEDTAVEFMKAGANNYVLKDNIKRLGPASIHALEERQIIAERENAQQALRDSETRYKLLAENITETVWLWDMNLKYIYVSPSWERVSGSTMEDRNNKPYDQRITSESLQRAMAALTEILSPENLQSPNPRLQCTLEMESHRDDGSKAWRENNFTLILDSEGKPFQIVGSGRDITQRKHAEEELRKAEQKYRGIFENAVEGIYQSSPEGRFITVNPALARMLGYDSPDEIIEKITDIENQIYAQPSRRVDFIRLMEENGSALAFEYQITRKDRSLIWVSENASAVRGSDGRILYYEGALENINQRKSAEEALRAAEEKFRSIFEQAPIGIFQSTPEGRFIAVNQAMADLYGYASPEEMIAQVTDIASQLYVHPSERLQFTKQMANQGETHNVEAETYKKDGSVIWVSRNAAAVKDKDGNILHYEGFLEDITERKHAEKRIENHLARLDALHTVDTVIRSSFDLRITLNVLLEQITVHLKVDAASVLLLDKDSFTLEYAASRGFRSTALQHTKLRPGEGYAGNILMDGQPLHIPDLTQTEGSLKAALMQAGERFIAYFGMPLVVKGQTLGVLEVFHRSPLNPDSEWVNFLENLANQAAIAVDNAIMFENLQHANLNLTMAYDAAIEGWSKAMELRDKETEGHNQRVADLTVKLARVMGISEPEIAHIRRGALLHDIGKIGIPDSILFKSGKLTEKEWKIMRLHPVYAKNMLSSLSYLKPAMEIPCCHHEKWDGTGYPQGLKGENIPLMARIFAIADVWDAIISDRPYRGKWQKKKALEYIKKQSGAHFDPNVVKAFIELISEKKSKAR